MNANLLPHSALACLALAAPALHAADATWDGGGAATEGWGAANHWSPNVTPTFDENLNVIFNAAGAGDLTNGFGVDRTIGSLSLGRSLSLQNSAYDTAGSVAGDATNGLRTTVTSLTLGGLTGNKNFASTGGVFTTNSGGYDAVTALTLNPGTGATPSYSGSIEDGATGMTLTKTGAGAQTLAGTNTYTGTTTVSAGTLYVTGALSNSAVTVETNGTIARNGAANGGLGNGLTIEEGGNIDLTGATLGSSSTGILGLTGGSLTLGKLTFQDLVGWDWLHEPRDDIVLSQLVFASRLQRDGIHCPTKIS